MLKQTPKVEDTKIMDTFKALGCKVSLRIFNLIENAGEWTINGDLAEVAGTTKIYYTNIIKLTQAGLVNRKRGKLSLTTYGKIVANIIKPMTMMYDELGMIKVIDSIDKTGMPEEEYRNIVERLIVNEKLREMLLTV